MAPTTPIKPIHLALIVLLLAGCASQTQTQPASTPTAIPATATLAPTFTPTIITSTPEPSATPTPTPLDPETQAFIDRNGANLADYLFFDPAQNVYVARMEFTGRFDEEIRPIKDPDGVLLGNAILSIEVMYFTGTRTQTALVALIVDRTADCIQRGTNAYPCTAFSQSAMLSTYRDGDGPFDGWQAGDRIEFWLPANGAPAEPAASDQIAKSYASANAQPYQTFLTTGDNTLDLLVPYRILMPCMPTVTQEHCYP